MSEWDCEVNGCRFQEGYCKFCDLSADGTHNKSQKERQAAMSQELTQAGREAREKVLAVYEQAFARQCISFDKWHVFSSNEDHVGISYSACGSMLTEDLAWIDAASRLPAIKPVPNDLSAPAGVERPKVYEADIHGDTRRGIVVHRASESDAYMDALEAQNATLRAQLEANPASLPYTLRANLESALSAFNAARAEDGWAPVTLVIPEGNKPQPAGLPYTLEECADVVNGVAESGWVDGYTLCDVVTSLRGMAK